MTANVGRFSQLMKRKMEAIEMLFYGTILKFPVAVGVSSKENLMINITKTDT